MLNIDITRAARSHQERVEVIQAVEAAPATKPETDWIEWKSALDISRAAGAFTAARQILGFGNRGPDYAARYARGCAYLLIGVEPGSLSGTIAHDPADVEQWLAPYVLRGEPQWSVDYLDVGGKTVMFVTVEAPQWGDPIFTLQKTFESAQAEAIFVRSNGKTDFHTPGHPSFDRTGQTRRPASERDP